MTSQDLTAQINTLGFKAVVVFIITAVVSLFLPLEAFAPTQEDAAYWLMNTMSGYVFGWVNQIVAMLACAVIFACAAWQFFATSPIRAVIIWMLTSLSIMTFLIVKFFNVWAVPMMAKALASGSAESDSAETFLSALAPSFAFGLGPSLDYLGFGLYAAISIMLFRPLYRLSTSAKISAIAFLLFGVSFFLLLVAPSISLLGQADIEAALYISSLPLVFAFIAIMVHFKANI